MCAHLGREKKNYQLTALKSASLKRMAETINLIC